MKITTKIAASFGLLIASLALPTQAQTAPTGPVLIKSLTTVRASRLSRLWKSPTVSVENYWTWMPEVNFYVTGPVTTGSQLSVEFTKSNGTPWYTSNCFMYKLDAGVVGRFQSTGASGHEDKRATTEVGTFGFKIRYKNALSGANQVLSSGKFQVSKFHKGNALPAFKNQFEYVVSQDWNLPIGWLAFDYSNAPKTPFLTASMWFRGDLDDTQLAGYLFYKGKQICSTKTDGTAYNGFSLLTTGTADNDPRWERWDFNFASVRGYNLDTESATNWDSYFFLSKNPGDYEIKVLREGVLARTAQFTVGADGAIVNNGLVTENNLGGIALVLPVKVLGTGDGKWDASAWKTGAFYGNPLKGFVAP